MLFNGNDNTVTDIAKVIGQTHPSMSIVVRKMKAAGLVTDSKSIDDHKNTSVNLTEKSKALKSLLRQLCEDVLKAVTDIESPDCHLWDEISN